MNAGFSHRLTQMARRMIDPEPTIREALRTAADYLPGGRPDPTPPEQELAGFGANPGRLRLRVKLPPQPRAGAPLLMLLHGCGQEPARFAAASGFADLAARLGAALLLPDQVADNNAQRCFNWFRPGDMRRGGGEAASLAQMVSHALDRYAADPARVFVAGLSAGGAMAAALLAAYPELFAGGGVVAGLPVGVATDIASAFGEMGRATSEPRAALVERVRPAFHGAHWPKLSVWHGGADHAVDPANSDALVAQWTGVLDLPAGPTRESRPAPGLRRRGWGDAVEQWTIAGLGHGFPVAQAGAVSDPFVLPAGIDAAGAMARFWGIGRD